MSKRILRRIATMIVTLLPILILWAILPYFAPGRIVPETPAAAPRWVEDGGNYGTCEAAMSGTPAPGRVVDINETRAAALGQGTVESQTDILKICSTSNHGIQPFEPL